MDKKKPILIICLQIVGVYILIVMKKTLCYSLAGHSIFDETYFSSLKMCLDVYEISSKKGVVTIQYVLGFLLIIMSLCSIVICIMRIANIDNKIVKGKLAKAINCLPVIILFLIIVVGRIPLPTTDTIYGHSLDSTSNYSLVADVSFVLAIGSVGIIGIILMIGSLVVANLPDSNKMENNDKIENNESIKRTIKRTQINNKKSSTTNAVDPQSLRDLKTLFEEGLITEEEYNEKRASILDRL